MTTAVVFLAAVVAFQPAPAQPAPGFVAGRVVDPDGRPIPGATVGVSSLTSEAYIEATTGADGRFKIGPVPPAVTFRRILYADAAGFGRQYRMGPPILPAATTEVGDIHMTLGRAYTGRVLDDKRQPIPGARVVCEVNMRMGRSRGVVGPRLELTTDVDGMYLLPPLPTGPAYLHFLATGRQQWGEFLDVEPGPPGTFRTQHLEPGVTYSGRVVDEDGKPVEGAVVGRFQLPYNQPPPTDAEGRFVLVGCGPNWTPSPYPVEKKGFVPGQFLAGEGEVVVKLVRPGWFIGKAVDAETGAAVRLDSARISIPPNPKAPPGVLPTSRATTLEQPEPGRFRVRFDAPGEYTLTLFADGYDPAEVVAPKAAERKTIDLPDVVKLKKAAVKPLREIAGTATRGGKSVAAGWAVLYRLYADPYGAPTIRSRAVTMDPYVYAEAEVIAGKFTLKVPQDKNTEWFVAVYEPNRPPGIVGPLPVPIGQPTPVTIDIPLPGSLAGKVIDFPVKYEGEGWVVAFSKVSGYRAEARIGRDGTYAFPALPPGEYGLKVGHAKFPDPDILDEAPKDGRLQPPADPWKRATLAVVRAGEKTVVKDLTYTEN